MLPKGSHPQGQSKLIDKILGYKVARIEQKYLKKYRAYDRLPAFGNEKKHYVGTQVWIGLDPQALQTPYSEILSFLKYLSPYRPQTIVDLGAAYGRIGVVLKSVLPDARFIGFEVMKERIDEARRMWEILDLKQCSIIEQNILDHDFELPEADVYFIYDFSNILHVRQILDRLKGKLKTKQFVIIARGEGICSLIKRSYPEFWMDSGLIMKHDWLVCSSSELGRL